MFLHCLTYRIIPQGGTAFCERELWLRWEKLATCNIVLSFRQAVMHWVHHNTTYFGFLISAGSINDCTYCWLECLSHNSRGWHSSDLQSTTQVKVAPPTPQHRSGQGTFPALGPILFCIQHRMGTFLVAETGGSTQHAIDKKWTTCTDFFNRPHDLFWIAHWHVAHRTDRSGGKRILPQNG